MKELQYEFVCKECDHSWEGDPYETYECPKCKCERFQTFTQLTCYCGETICLTSFTNTCEKCGNMYNQSGQELAPISDWLPDY